MRTSCIAHPQKEPLVVIHKWQVEACDENHCAAALLSYLEYWHNIRLDQVSRERSQRAIAQYHGQDPGQGLGLLQFHKEQDLIDGMVGLFKRDSIRKAIDLLVQKDFVSIHSNPNKRLSFDRTRYFLFHANEVNEWIRLRNDDSVQCRKIDDDDRKTDDHHRNLDIDLYTETTLTTAPDLPHAQSSQITEAERTGVGFADLEDERSSPDACGLKDGFESPWNDDLRLPDRLEVKDGGTDRRKVVELHGMASYAEASEGVKRETRSGTTKQPNEVLPALAKNTLEGRSSAAAKKNQKSNPKKEPRFHRSGAFSPIGAPKNIQRAVLRAMQVWVWDEWSDVGFRIVQAPDGKVWYYDPNSKDDSDWFLEDDLISITKMLDLATDPERSHVTAIDIDALNEYAIGLFEDLKTDKATLKEFSTKPTPIAMGFKIERVDWDELPDECFGKSEAALPF